MRHNDLVRKAFTFVLVILQFLSLPNLNAVTPIKAGSVCTKINQIKFVNSLKFTCVKSGKKLVWSKGSPIKPKTDSKLDVNPYDGIVLNWENVENYNNALVYKIWKEWIATENKINNKFNNREIFIGPNVYLDDINPKAYFDNAEKKFAWTQIPFNYKVIYAGIKDQYWADSKFKELYDTDQNIKLEGCRINYCLGGNVSKVKNRWIHVNISWDSKLAPESMKNFLNPAGGLEMHEFVHVVQYSYATGEKSLATPAWINEGGATFFASLGLSQSFERYQYQRYESSKTFRYCPECIESKINELFSSSPDIQLGDNYTVGYFVTEALTGIYGLDATFRLIRNASVAESFSEAFKLTFNEDWETVKPKLVRLVKYQIMLPRGF